MRVLSLLLSPLLLVAPLHAQRLTAADRETLLENLEKLKDVSDSSLSARYAAAIAAYRNALTSDDAAMNLYMNCVEKVNFTDQLKKPADFREWKRNEGEKLSDIGLRLALRHQIRWLILTLQAASPNAERGKLVSEAQDAVDAVFRDLPKMKNQEQTLNQAVTSSVFARAYDVNNVKLENWPLSPVDLGTIYGTVLLPPYRNPASISSLRAGWIKRIQQETIKRENWTNRRGGDEDKRIGTIASMQSPELTKYMEEELPRPQWQMEMCLKLAMKTAPRCECWRT